MFTSQISEGDWVESKLTCVASSNHFQLLQVGTFLHLGSWLPKKVELEQVAQLMKTDPKDLGNLYKNSHRRELRLLILEKGSFRWINVLHINSTEGKCGKCLRGQLLFHLVVTFRLKIILLRAECFTEIFD